MLTFSKPNGFRSSESRWTLASATTGDAAVAGDSLIAAAVQFVGIFGGATAKLEISLDGANWLQAYDRNGYTISATAAGLYEISSAAPFIRAVTTGGDGTTAITAILVTNNI